MNNNNQKMKRAGSQKGIALLFALAILSLLLVMVIGFATNAIFDQRTAFNSANVASAKIMAQSELNKVFTLLKYYDNGIFYSHSTDTLMMIRENNVTNSAKDKPTSDMLERLQTKQGSYVFQWKTGYDSYINWNYIKINDGAGERIIGRTAFALIPDEGIDPGTLVNKNLDESSATEKRIGAAVDEINVMSVDASITADLAKVFNYSVIGGYAVIPNTNEGQYSGNWIDFPTMFSWFASAGQPLGPSLKDNFRKWFVIDVPNDKEAFWIDLNDDNVIDNADYANLSFELYHRFYLPHYTDNNGNGIFDAGDTNNWDTIDIDTGILLDNDKNGIPDIALTKWVPAGPVTTPGGIPWLAFYGYKPDGTTYTSSETPVSLEEVKGTFTNLVDIRRQIAANLVEYCKSPITGIAADSAISNSSDWLTIPPAYTGNKKTPYINEFGGHVKADAAITAAATPGNFDIIVTLGFRLYSEIINIYSAPWTRNLRLNVTGRFTYDYDVGNSGTVAGVEPINIDINAFNWSIAAGQGYGTNINTVNTVVITQNDIPAANAHATISNVKFRIDRAVLYEPGAPNIFYDYAGINTETSTIATLVNLASLPGADTQNCWFSIETEDPRQNLNTGDWAAKNPGISNVDFVTTLSAIWTANTVAGALQGVTNTNSSPVARHGALPATSDLEIVADPANGNMSTAFIRNGPMLSPWELGFIHRGQRWQTINLKEYDKFKAARLITVAGNDYCPGGGAYNDPTPADDSSDTVDGGDANILDQIKMTDQTNSPKKINIKTHLDEVLKALLNKVKIGCVPDGTMSLDSMSSTTGVAINAVNATELIGKIKEKNINFFTRAGIADVAEYSLGSADPAFPAPPVLPPLNVASRNTDATQEELIGKTVNLCEIGGQIEFFTIIVLAQTIRDVGTNGGAGINIVKVDKNGNKHTMTEVKLGVFDYTLIGTYTEDGISKKNCVYADEIIGEQKIKVRGFRDASGNCKVLSMEYVE